MNIADGRGGVRPRESRLGEGRPAAEARTWGREDGRVLLLGLAIGLVAAALLAALASVATVHLQRKSLYVVADLAALAGAEAFAPGSLYESAPVAPTPGEAQAAVRRYLADITGVATCADVHLIEVDVRADGVTHVALGCRARIPVVSTLWEAWAGGIEIVATSQARVAVE